MTTFFSLRWYFEHHFFRTHYQFIAFQFKAYQDVFGFRRVRIKQVNPMILSKIRVFIQAPLFNTSPVVLRNTTALYFCSSFSLKRAASSVKLAEKTLSFAIFPKATFPAPMDSCRKAAVLPSIHWRGKSRFGKNGKRQGLFR